MRRWLVGLGLVLGLLGLAGGSRGAGDLIDGLSGASISEKARTFAFNNDDRGEIPAREITLSYQGAERVERVILLVASEPSGPVVYNRWDASDWGKSCRELYALATALGSRAGYAATDPGYGLDNCGNGSWRSGTLVLKPAAPRMAAAAQCDAKAYLGAWVRPGAGGQSAQVRLVFETPPGATKPMGRTMGFRNAPYADGEAVVSEIEPPKACAFRAQCAAPLSSANPCTLTVDPAAGTLRIKGGAKMFISEVVWTRATTPAKPEGPACQAADIEGDWRRTDGAQITVSGVKFKDGGNALLFNHPTGNWPKGAFKFTGIKPAGACKWTAECATVYRDAGNGAFNTIRSACTLSVDPKTRTLTASGTHGVFKR